MKRWLCWLPGIATGAGMVLLLAKSAAVNRAVAGGVQLCLTILVPSLFVFLIVSDIAVKTGALDRLLRPFGIVCGRLFHIDRSFGPLLLLSLLCGYPVGARLLAAMVKEGRLSKKEAGRMLCFCVNAGPAFLFGSVALPLFGSLQMGAVLLLSHLAAFFTVGILTGIGKRVEPVRTQPVRLPPAEALVEAVRGATGAMAGICGFVLLFSGLMGLLHEIGAFGLLRLPALQAAATGLLEVSNGVLACQKLPAQLSLLLVAGTTAFGGLCVHGQIQAIVGKAGIPLSPFIRWRLAYTGVSVSACLFLSHFVQLPAAVFASVQAKAGFAAQSPVGSVLLLLLSACLLCCDKKSAIIRKNGRRTRKGQGNTIQ